MKLAGIWQMGGGIEDEALRQRHFRGLAHGISLASDA
jgi:hypothetical protein